MAITTGVARAPEADLRVRRALQSLKALNKLIEDGSLVFDGDRGVRLNITLADLPDHAVTHEDGGTDELSVLDLGGFPGGGTTFLRDDGTFAAVPAGGLSHPQVMARGVFSGPF